MDNTNVTTEETTSTTTAPQATTCLGTENSFPVIPVPPTVTNAVLSGGVRFDCQLQAAEAGSIYYVTWSSSGTVLRNETLTGGDLLDSFDTTGLPESTRSSIITSGVTCSVRASNPARCGDGVSPAVSITLDLTKLSVTRPTQSVLQAATETSLTVSFKNQVTPEFYCALMYGQTCVVLVEVQTSQETPWKCIGGDPIEALSVRSLTTPTSGAGDVCGTHLSSVSSQQVMLRPSVDNIVRSAVNVTVDVRQVDVVGQQRVNTELLDVITLTVEGSMETVSSCRVYADPHVVTFDGLTYDVMRPGRFLVYKHKELDLEVEGYFFTTGNGASACGFGIRSGDDVIRVSRCGSPMSTKVFLVGGQLTAHTKVYQEEEGNKIKVFLPTGTVVIVTGSYSDIDTGDSGMVHLEIRPSALDFGQTQGLCGTYDGDSSNDLTSRFGQVFTLNPDKDPNDFTGTWAVAESDSLFGGFQGRATSSFTDTYCSCQRNTAPVCADFGFVAECGVSFAGTDITQTLVEDYQLNQGLQQTQQTQTNTARRRRQTTSNTREVFTFDPNFTDPANATWPTAKGITEGQAKQRCENAIVTSPVYSTCSQFSADNFTTEINSCVRDIQLMDDLAWVDAAVQTIQERCGTDIAVNSSLWQDPNPTSASVTPTLATILQSLCPNQCSGFGSCNDGTCDCIPGYGGTDCSFKVSLAPTVASQASHALCQSDIAACNRTFVRGEHFMENVGELSCHLTPIEVGETGITSRGATLLSTATYRSQYEVLCALPEPRSYAIKVSNDKQSTSLHEALYVVYNPKCFDCQLDASSPTCTPKSLTCLIDGQCYNNGETDPTDSCRVCSLASYDSWSTNSVAGCQSTTLSTTTTEGRGNDRSSRFNEETTIIGASLASVIVVLAIIGITVYVIRRRQRRRTQRELVSRSSDHSSYERNYDGSFGVRTQKSLAFKNPTQMHYESTLDH